MYVIIITNLNKDRDFFLHLSLRPSFLKVLLDDQFSFSSVFLDNQLSFHYCRAKFSHGLIALAVCLALKKQERKN